MLEPRGLPEYVSSHTARRSYPNRTIRIFVECANLVERQLRRIRVIEQFEPRTVIAYQAVIGTDPDVVVSGLDDVIDPITGQAIRPGEMPVNMLLKGNIDPQRVGSANGAARQDAQQANGYCAVSKTTTWRNDDWRSHSSSSQPVS